MWDNVTEQALIQDFVREGGWLLFGALVGGSEGMLP